MNIMVSSLYTSSLHLTTKGRVSFNLTRAAKAYNIYDNLTDL